MIRAYAKGLTLGAGMIVGLTLVGCTHLADSNSGHRMRVGHGVDENAYFEPSGDQMRQKTMEGAGLGTGSGDQGTQSQKVGLAPRTPRVSEHDIFLNP